MPNHNRSKQWRSNRHSSNQSAPSRPSPDSKWIRKIPSVSVGPFAEAVAREIARMCFICAGRDQTRACPSWHCPLHRLRSQLMSIHISKI